MSPEGDVDSGSKVLDSVFCVHCTQTHHRPGCERTLDRLRARPFQQILSLTLELDHARHLPMSTGCEARDLAIPTYHRPGSGSSRCDVWLKVSEPEQRLQKQASVSQLQGHRKLITGYSQEQVMWLSERPDHNAGMEPPGRLHTHQNPLKAKVYEPRQTRQNRSSEESA